MPRLARAQLNEYINHYIGLVRKKPWRESEKAMAIASAEETVREILKKVGYTMPRRGKP